MAEELRLALILLGALAIGSVILHGIWTVRRTVNEERKAAKQQQEEESPEIAPEEEEAQKLKLKQMEMDFATLAEAEEKGEGIPVASMDVDSIYNKEQSEQEQSAETVEQATEEVDTEQLVQEQAQSQPQQESQQQPAQQTQMLGDVELEDETLPSFSTLDIDDEPEVNIDFASINTDDEPVVGTQADPEKQEVLMLYIDKTEGTPIDGAKLLPTLLTLGFKYGEMDLFHRHQDSSGKGEILFSLANMYNPGTFDIDNMEQLTTRGLTIFMTLPNAAEPLQTFNMMHNAAKKIADEFGATVLDDKRNPLDVAIVRSYVEKIRKF